MKAYISGFIYVCVVKLSVYSGTSLTHGVINHVEVINY